MYKKFDALIQRVTISLKNGAKPLDYGQCAVLAIFIIYLSIFIYNLHIFIAPLSIW